MELRKTLSEEVIEAQTGDLSDVNRASWLTKKFLDVFGFGRLLLIAPDGAALIKSLRAEPLDITHIDLLSEPSQSSNALAALDNNSFDTIILVNSLEHLGSEGARLLIAACYRITRGQVFGIVSSSASGLKHAGALRQSRKEWEDSFFDAGFRKHPGFLDLVHYTTVDDETEVLLLGLEKVPENAAKEFSMARLQESRGLHMDMLRDSGTRSDAHIIRYHWASSFIKEGDVVLDAACGLGYGAWMMYRRTRAHRVLGIDGSDYAIRYGKASYGRGEHVQFQEGFLPDCLTDIADNSVDLIACFETLEHVEDPLSVLKEFFRILKPGGRVCVSVPNDWSDESGTDPNPFHLHVYDWSGLRDQLATYFLPETAVALTANQYKRLDDKATFELAPRSMHEVDIDSAASPMQAEWWLMSAVKDPIANTAPYVEQMYANLNGCGFENLNYDQAYSNPWMATSVVNGAARVKNAKLLNSLISRQRESGVAVTSELAAYVCVEAYQLLSGQYTDDAVVAKSNECLEISASLDEKNLHELRWKASLLFVAGKLAKAGGLTDQALDAYMACGKLEVAPFCIQLSTKTTEALYLAGALSLSKGDLEGAELAWSKGVQTAKSLTDASVEDVLINPERPNFFHHGDGVREYALAWDHVAKCANGLRSVRDTRGSRNYEMSARLIFNSSTNEISGRDVDLAYERSGRRRKRRLLRKKIYPETSNPAQVRKGKLSRAAAKVRNFLRRLRR